MISAHKTTSVHSRGRDRSRRPLSPRPSLSAALKAPCVALLLCRASLAPAQEPQQGSIAQQPLSEPIALLKRLTWSDEEGPQRLEISAEHAEWLDAQRRVALSGAVSLSAASRGGGRLTMSCLKATLTLGDRGQVSALELTGPVRVSGAGLSLEASSLSWRLGRALRLEGRVTGRWRAHQVEAERVAFWPDEGRLALEGLRAQIALPKPRDRVIRARER